MLVSSLFQTISNKIRSGDIYKSHTSCVGFPEIVDFQFTAVATKSAYNRFCGKTHEI